MSNSWTKASSSSWEITGWEYLIGMLVQFQIPGHAMGGHIHHAGTISLERLDSLSPNLLPSKQVPVDRSNILHSPLLGHKLECKRNLFQPSCFDTQAEPTGKQKWQILFSIQWNTESTWGQYVPILATYVKRISQFFMELKSYTACKACTRFRSRGTSTSINWSRNSLIWADLNGKASKSAWENGLAWQGSHSNQRFFRTVQASTKVVSYLKKNYCC